VNYADVDSAVCGSVYSDSTAGQTCLYRLGLTGIPVLNVNNNCATGSSALDTARRFVQGGNRCVLALGFEKMNGNLQESPMSICAWQPCRRATGSLQAVSIPATGCAGLGRLCSKIASTQLHGTSRR